MSRTLQRSLEDHAGGIVRYIRALGRNPSEWDPEDLILIRKIRGELDKLEAGAVFGMREHGVTDKQIGEALGITQQAVSKRWPGGGRYVGAAGRYRKP